MRKDVPRILVIGAGVSGLLGCILLRRLGYDVIVTKNLSRAYDALEAVPDSIQKVLTAIGEPDVLSNVDARATIGFGDQRHYVLDRSRLAEYFEMRAIQVGAAVMEAASRLNIRIEGSRAVVEKDGAVQSFDMLIDASGRAARWSRPITRFQEQVADLYLGPSGGKQQTKYHKMESGWCYLLDNGCSALIGVIGHRRPINKTLPGAIANLLGVDSGDVTFSVRRPASAQWATSPVNAQRISIGDAAVAHEPLVGQGIRFALTSALAASISARTIFERPKNASLARSYYHHLVRDERDRHIGYLQNNSQDLLNKGANKPSFNLCLPHDVLRFNGKLIQHPIIVDGFVNMGEALKLPDAKIVRWIGGIDVLLLRDSLKDPKALGPLKRLLVNRGLQESAAAALISWGLTNQVLQVYHA